jgi:barstar (barnase inhibitor)
MTSSQLCERKAGRSTSCPARPPTKKAWSQPSVRSFRSTPPIKLGKWEALSDSLWEGLHALNADKVAILWPDSDRLRRADSDAYASAVDMFRDLVFGLADPKFTVDHVTRVLVLLA